MHLRAGLALIAAACFGAATAPADAATYCAPTDRAAGECDGDFGTIQEALDAAAGHAGPDDVLIRTGLPNKLTAGLVYSDHGQADNGVTITGSYPTISGGTPGDTLLAFTGGGGADVAVLDVSFSPGPGVTGLMLPPGGRADVNVYGDDGSIGIRAEGTAARPALIEGFFSNMLGGATDIGIDAVGATVVDHPSITSDIGARSRGTDGLLDIRGGSITGRVGVTGRSALLTRTLVDLRRQEPALGFEAACPDAGAPDAVITARNVTVLASGGAGSTGARAIGRGGDGTSCNALVRLNSSILNGFATSLDALGDSGSGADPRDGLARFDMAYSNFDPESIRQSGPSVIGTASPGGNVYGDPHFNPHPLLLSEPPILSWDSPLIDHGDPAPLEPSEVESLASFRPGVVNGRRDIGGREYEFGTPVAHAFRGPRHAIPRLGAAELGVSAGDVDLDPLRVRWTFWNGQHADYRQSFEEVTPPTVRRVYPITGTFVEQVTVTDPTGRSGTSQVAVRVVRQWMRRLAVVPRRMRPSALESVPTDTEIRFATRVPGPVNFRIQRGVPRGDSGALRWVGTRFHFRGISEPSERPELKGLAVLRFNGWQRGHVLRPGRYRLVAKPPGARPMRVRFRMLKVHL